MEQNSSNLKKRCPRGQKLNILSLLAIITKFLMILQLFRPLQNDETSQNGLLGIQNILQPVRATCTIVNITHDPQVVIINKTQSLTYNDVHTIVTADNSATCECKGVVEGLNSQKETYDGNHCSDIWSGYAWCYVDYPGCSGSTPTTIPNFSSYISWIRCSHEENPILAQMNQNNTEARIQLDLNHAQMPSRTLKLYRQEQGSWEEVKEDDLSLLKIQNSALQMILDDVRLTQKTYKYKLEIEFTSIDPSCQQNKFEVMIDAFLQELCSEISKALDYDSIPFEDNDIYVMRHDNVTNNYFQQTYLDYYAQWSTIPSNPNACDIYKIEFLNFVSSETVQSLPIPNNQGFILDKQYLYESHQEIEELVLEDQVEALQIQAKYRQWYKFYSWESTCGSNPNCFYMRLQADHENAPSPKNYPQELVGLTFTDIGQEFNALKCMNGGQSFSPSSQFIPSKCCWVDSRKGPGVNPGEETQQWSVQLDQTYKVVAVKLFLFNESMSGNLEIYVDNTLCIQIKQYTAETLQEISCENGGVIGSFVHIRKYKGWNQEYGSSFCNVRILGHKLKDNSANKHAYIKRLPKMNTEYWRVGNPLQYEPSLIEVNGLTQYKINVDNKNLIFLNLDDPNLNKFISFKIRVSSRSGRQEEYTIKIQICRTQKITATQLYLDNSIEWLSEKQRLFKVELIGGMGSDDFPKQKNFHIVDLRKLFTFTETGDYDTSKMPGYAKDYCTQNIYTICEDLLCTKVLFKDLLNRDPDYDQVKLSSFSFYPSDTPAQRLALTPKQMVIDISQLTNNNAAGSILQLLPSQNSSSNNQIIYEDIYLKIENRAEDQFPVQKIKFVICGDEQLTVINSGPRKIIMNDKNQVKQEIDFKDIFKNTMGDDCGISTYNLNHDNKLNNIQISKLITLTSTSMEISMEGFKNPQNIKKFSVTLEVSTKSGASSEKTFQIDISSFIEPEPVKDILQRAYNSGPQDLFPIDQPWRAEIGHQEILKFQHQIVDIQGDQMTFEWEGLPEFIQVSEEPQDEVIKQFTLLIRPGQVEQQQVFEFTLVASDGKESAEFEYSIEFYLPLVGDESLEEIGAEDTEENGSSEDKIEDVKPSTESFEGIQVPLKTFEQIEFVVEAETVHNTDKEPKKEKKRERKKKVTPPPAIKFGSVSPKGEVPVKFNQPLLVPKNFEQVDYSSVFDVAIQAGIDGSIVKGQFVSYSLLKQRRQMSGLDDCDEDCAASDKQFQWTVNYHDPTGMGIKLEFEDSRGISTSSYGQDGLALGIKQKQFFVSAETKEALDESGLPKSDCGDTGAQMCKLVPPMIENEEEIESIEATSDNMQASMQAIAFTNIAMSILFGGLIQQLLGLVKVLQIVLLQACITIVYPGNLTFFYSLVVQLAELDFLQGTTIYEAVFQFKETSAFSPTFEQYEMGDMNFFMNSGSLMVIVFLTTVNFIVWIIIFYLSKYFYRNKTCRKMGIIAQDRGQFKKPMQKLFLETYIDIIVAASLNFYAINQAEDFDDFLEFFGSYENLLSSTITISSIFFGYLAPFYIFSVLYRHKEQLQSPSILEKYGVFYEEYDFQSQQRMKSFFTVIAMGRRLVMLAIMMRLSHQPSIQNMLFIFSSLASVAVLLALKPYRDSFTNKIECMNELTIYVNSFITQQFMQNTSYDEMTLRSTKETMGYMVITNICLNMVVNMAIISVQSFFLLYEFTQDKIKEFNHQTQIEKQDKAEKVFAEQLGSDYNQIHEDKQSEKEALQWCKEYALQRQWCFDNEIDFRDLPEEKQFWDFIRQFGFEKRREQIKKEIELREQVYVAGMATQRLAKTKNIDAKLGFFEDMKKQEQIQRKKYKINHFQPTRQQSFQMQQWRAKAIEQIEECSLESGSVSTVRESDLNIDKKQNDKKSKIKSQLFEQMKNTKTQSEKNLMNDLKSQRKTLVKCKNEQNQMNTNLPGSLKQRSTIDLETLKSMKLQTLNQKPYKSNQDTPLGRLEQAICDSTDVAFQQQLKREQDIEKRIQLLDKRYVIRDQAQIYELQEETFDFITHFEFDKFGKQIKEEDFFNTQYGNNQEIPIVAGKKFLFQEIKKARKLQGTSDQDNSPILRQFYKEQWLRKCKQQGFIEISHSIRDDPLHQSSIQLVISCIAAFLQWLKEVLGCSTYEQEIKVEIGEIDPEMLRMRPRTRSRSIKQTSDINANIKKAEYPKHLDQWASVKANYIQILKESKKTEEDKQVNIKRRDVKKDPEIEPADRKQEKRKRKNDKTSQKNKKQRSKDGQKY